MFVWLHLMRECTWARYVRGCRSPPSCEKTIIPTCFVSYQHIPPLSTLHHATTVSQVYMCNKTPGWGLLSPISSIYIVQRKIVHLFTLTQVNILSFVVVRFNVFGQDRATQEIVKGVELSIE